MRPHYLEASGARTVKADPRGVLTGTHFLDGDVACGEGAMAAGCRFVAGYPITPSTEVVERIGRRFPTVGGIFIQMEDELASMAAIVGGSWSGTKSMTVTSGPGFSLMMENIGLAAMMETPVVVVDVQRAGPSTGLPTMVGQGDMMQARWGSHGPYEIIALCPSSPQELFDLTIRAFNLSEQFRTPVLVMTDAEVGHMTEKVVIPPLAQIPVYPRRKATTPPDKYRPYEAGEDLVPLMVNAGDGYRIHVTGLTHDERGYPMVDAETQQRMIPRLVEKIRQNRDKMIEVEERDLDDAEVVVVTYGISARTAHWPIEQARSEGIRAGMLRLITAWPFPEAHIRRLAARAKAFVVVEINLGQMVYEVERCAAGKAATYLAAHAGGDLHDPDDILRLIRKAAGR